MAWFEIADGRLRFRGRVTKQPIDEWLATAEATRAVDAAAHRMGFTLFGRTRAARRRLARELWRALQSPSAREMVAIEGDRYTGAWTDLAYAPALPRVTVSLHRLVVIPRAMILGRAGSDVMPRIGACPGLTDAGEAFIAFFCRWILGQMDDAIRRARPSPRRPVHARDSWACVAVDDDFTWVDPEWSGPEWRGHIVVFEMPVPRLPRRDRQELESRIHQLLQSLPNLTRQQRDGTVRLAADQMASLTLRAR